MDLGLKDRVAIVAASSRGLGKACALELAREGVRVVICARDADRLAAYGITYAPDFVVNAGGVINISHEESGYDWQRAAAAVDSIREAVSDIFAIADRDGMNPVDAAIKRAKARIEKIGGLKTRLTPGGAL